jgi:hypothetical protein
MSLLRYTSLLLFEILPMFLLKSASSGLKIYPKPTISDRVSMLWLFLRKPARKLSTA